MDNMVCESTKGLPLAKENFNAIDLAKFVAALLVVVIHVPPLTSVDQTVNFVLKSGIARLAVPFFFMASGYFLSNKIDDWQSTKKYIFKILRMYLLWILVYSPRIIYGWLTSETLILSNITNFARKSIFEGSANQFWYLTALIFAVALLYCLRKVSRTNLFFVALFLFFMGVLGNSYYGLTEKVPILHKIFSSYFAVFETTRNGLFFGFVFVLMGTLTKNKLPSRKKCIIGLTASMALMYLEIFILKYFSIAKLFDMYFSLIPASFSLFGFLLQTKLPDQWNFHRLRQMSLQIFLVHMLIFFFSKRLVHLSPVFDHSLIKYGIVVVLSIACSLCWLWLENKKRFVWLKYLH